MVPNFSKTSSIVPIYSDRRGRTCYPKSLIRSSFQDLRDKSLFVHGIKLFNCIPKNIRNLTNCSKEKFKSSLDMFLKLIPDEPQIPGYTKFRSAHSNSILHMYRYVKQSGAVCNSYFQTSSSAANGWKSEDFGQDK